MTTEEALNSLIGFIDAVKADSAASDSDTFDRALAGSDQDAKTLDAAIRLLRPRLPICPVCSSYGTDRHNTQHNYVPGSCLARRK